MNTFIINRVWAMPNKNTFNIKPIHNLIRKYIQDCTVIIDPYANNNTIATISNDINPEFDTTYHLEATEFLKKIETNSADLILFDPPYSPRQISECYKKFNLSVNMQTTQSSYWSVQKDNIARILKTNGICITCSWNSNGIGKKRGFELIELLIVAHGGWHNDTIITVERKIN